MPLVAAIKLGEAYCAELYLHLAPLITRLTRRKLPAFSKCYFGFLLLHHLLWVEQVRTVAAWL